MTWADLFDRAADYDVDEEQIADALREHRDADE
jgi:uncharacterized protein (DUF433 family)